MKKFIVLANLNAMNYKEIFPYVMEKKLWMGPSITTGARWFVVPDDYTLKEQDARFKDGHKEIRIAGVRWITDVPVDKPYDLKLTEKYEEGKYKRYDNFNAINIDKIKDIPLDYEGPMGVPITVMDRIWKDGLIHFENATYEMLGVMNNGKVKYDLAQPRVDGKVVFKRILIKKIA